MSALNKTVLFVMILCSALTIMPTNAQFFGGYGLPYFGYGYGGFGGFGGYGYGLGYGLGYSTICCSIGLPFYGGFFGKR